MSATTQNRDFSGEGAGLSFAQIGQSWNGPIAASANLKTGALAGILRADTSTGYPGIVDFVGDASVQALGFVTLGGDNAGGAKGAMPCRVQAQVGCLIDKNAGGGSAITIADRYKPIYGADNQTCSKVSSDGDLIGMLVGIDPTTGRPMVLVSPVVQKLIIGVAKAAALTALTDSTGGTPGSTLAALNGGTLAGVDGTGSNAAPLAGVNTALGLIRNDIASLATAFNAIRTALGA